MTGLYILVVMFFWVMISYLVFKILYKWNKKGFRVLSVALSVIFLFVWLFSSFWYLGGRKIYYDWLVVDKFCAIDGGISVFESVYLPETSFDKYGNVGIESKNNSPPDSNYYFESVKENLRDGNIRINRSITKIVRKSDGKVLGESVRYSRGGGDMPGPWESSFYSCPSIKEAEGELEKSIFKRMK